MGFDMEIGDKCGVLRALLPLALLTAACFGVLMLVVLTDSGHQLVRTTVFDLIRPALANEGWDHLLDQLAAVELVP